MTTLPIAPIVKLVQAPEPAVNLEPKRFGGKKLNPRKRIGVDAYIEELKGRK